MSATLWFTGLPCSGKTTTARGVLDLAAAAGIEAEFLDSDPAAGWLGRICSELKGSREAVAAAMGLVAFHLNRRGVVAVCAATTPRRAFRHQLRKRIPGYIEVFCRASLTTVRSRDSLGLYHLADLGVIDGFTGVAEAYEEAENPDLVLDMDTLEPEDCVARAFTLLSDRLGR